MTREKALKVWHDSVGFNEVECSYKLQEAISTAFRELEKEPCEDCVSRQAAIALAKDICVPTKDGTVYKYRCIDPDEIRGLPPIQPKIKTDGDTISRQAVLEIQAKYAEYVGASKFWKMRDDIKALPPVTPQPKMGQWINDRCSECGKGIEDLIDSREWYENEQPNFCPFCGIPIRKRG